MDAVLDTLKIIVALVGGTLGWLLGGLDSLVYGLIALVAIDYVTGVTLAIYEKNISSEIGFKGISKKVWIFAMVALGNIVDQCIFGSGSSLRTMLVTFYMANEGISILENSAKMGVPFPQKLKDVLLQITNTDNK